MLTDNGSLAIQSITSPTDKNYKRANSKFNTSLACKSIFTFFVATENKKCKIKSFYTFFVEVSWNPYEKCIKNFFYILRQQYRRKMYKLRKKVHLYIFRSLYIVRQCILTIFYFPQFVVILPTPPFEIHITSEMTLTIL